MSTDTSKVDTPEIETTEIDSFDVDSASTTFAELGVPSFISDALARRGITQPFEIQAVTIADALAGRDVCGRAPTGSGKTLAFGVPLITNLHAHGRGEPRKPSALILAPTRELAEQIATELRSFSGSLRIDAVYGGVGYGGQISALRRGIDVLVACPGRLEDLIERRDVSLSAVRFVVIDEADRMADMGFMPSVKRLLDQTSKDRQTVLFSATLDGDVANLTKHYQRNPVRHEVGEATPDIKAADHVFWKLDKNDRNDLIAEVVKVAWPSIIFTRTRHGADRLAKQLGRLGIEAAPIHGGLSQSQRNRALDNFTKSRVHALVATDVAARGIHVDGVASVIHYDPPADHKDYTHRSGRTARAGANGLVISMLASDQLKDARKMMRLVGLDGEISAPNVDAIGEANYGTGQKLAPPAPAAPERPVAKMPRREGRSDGSGERRESSGGGGGRDGQQRQRRDFPRSPRDRNVAGDTGAEVGRDARRNEARPSGARPARPATDRYGKSTTDRYGKPTGDRPRGGASRASKPSAKPAGKQPNRKQRRAHLQTGTG